MGKHEEMPQVEGYVAEKRTISLLGANIFSIALLAVLMLAGFLLMRLFWPSVGIDFGRSDMLLLMLVFVVGIVLHELIHGLTWLLATHKGFSHLSFGFLKMSPYCHIDVPMPKRQYVAGALMPLLLLGVLPSVVALAMGNYLWLLIGIIFITAAAGDIMIVWAVRKESADTLVYDHPSEAGCFVYHREG